jgi:tetratricopeptide (TPR) repeat protein
VPSMYDEEGLLYESATKVDASGASIEVTRSVWRILKDDPDQTVTLTWAPWHQEKPTVRARVVNADGTATALDVSTLVEGSVVVADLQISDVHQLQVPLPNARRGAVVELEVTRINKRPLLPGAGRMSVEPLFSLSPMRKRRFTLEVPLDVPLKLEVVGTPAPVIRRSGSAQHVALEIGELKYNLRTLTQSEIEATFPHFGWSTARSWVEVGRAYSQVIESTLAEKTDVDLGLPKTASTLNKVQAVLRFVQERLRYTAIHLGQGAIVPTSPAQVLRRGYGDCKDLSVLVANVLRANGVAASVALTSIQRAPATEALPGLEAFNHMVVRVTDNGKYLWVDATAPTFPAGVVPPATYEQKALVIDGSFALTSLPKRKEMPSKLSTTYALTFAAFGSGSAEVNLSFEGALEGSARARIGACDEATARGLIARETQRLFGAAPFVATVSGCKPGDGAVKAQAVLSKATALDTGDAEATIRLPSNIVDLMVPDAVIGTRPGNDDRTDDVRADEARRLKERTGLTEAETRTVTWSPGFDFVIERTYLVRLPPHFVVATLPDNRRIPLGPALLEESARRLDASTIEVSYRFSPNKLEWSVADVEAFRSAYWQRYDDAMPSLTAQFEPLRLLNDNQTSDAVKLMKKWLTEKPNDGPTRARFARVLLNLGLGELAKKEIERAAKDAPKDALTLMVRGDIARHDNGSALFEPPFERATSIDSFKRALALMPDHSWAVTALAETLRRNAQGEQERDWTADVAEAAKLLQGAVDRNESSKQQVGLLAELYTSGRKVDELKRLFEREADQRAGSEMTATIADAVLKGPDASLARIARFGEAKERLQSIATLTGLYVQLRQYDNAKRVLQYDPGAAVQQELNLLRSFAPALQPIRAPKEVRTAEDASRRLMALAFEASTPSDFIKSLSALASTEGRDELSQTRQLLNVVSFPDLKNELNWLLLFHNSRCATSSAGPFARVRCEVPDVPKVRLTSYWVKDGTSWKLDSLGGFTHFVKRANGTTAAATWIEWYLDELEAQERQTMGTQLLRDFWAQAQRGDTNDLRLAGAIAELSFGDFMKKASPSTLERLETALPRLSGSLKRRLSTLLSSAYETRRDFLRAIKFMTPVAESENEPWMWRRLASLESHAGKNKEADARIKAALGRNPGDVEWRQSKGFVLLQSGRYAEAVDVFEQLRKEKGAMGVDVSNNLLWARLMADRINDDSEAEVRRMVEADQRPSEAELHTAAMVLLERSKIREAARLSIQRSLTQTEPDDAQWLFEGRLLSLLGYPEESRAAFAKMSSDDKEMTELKRRWSK